MTQEEANKVFASGFGSQLNSIYVTSDDHCFIRYEEAVRHTQGELDPDYPEPLSDKTINEFFKQYE